MTYSFVPSLRALLENASKDAVDVSIWGGEVNRPAHPSVLRRSVHGG